MVTCPRCEGKGHLVEYGHIRGGLCFKCNGRGKINRPRKSRAKQVDPNIAIESKRKIDLSIELYKEDGRAGVPYGHTYFYMHAVELAKLDGVWETL